MKDHIATVFSCVLLLASTGCAREYIGEDPPTDRLHFPTGVALSPTDRRLLVVSSNFDLGYNRGAVHAVDLDAVDAALDGQTEPLDAPLGEVIDSGVRSPSFGGPLRFSPDGRHAFVAHRSDGSLLELELAADGTLSCGDRGAAPQDCTDGDHLLRLSSSDPYALNLWPRDDQTVELFVGGLSGGAVDLVTARFDVDGAERLTLPLSIDSKLYRASGLARLPARGIAPEYLLIAGELRPGSGDGRSAGAYLVLYATAYGSDQQLGSVPLVNANQAIDARAVTLSADGLTAYVAQRNPDSVAAIDLSAGPSGLPRFRAFAVQSVGRQPVTLALDSEAPGGPQLLVPCFGERALYALDGRTLQVRGVLGDLPGSPADIAVDASNGRVYLTLFERDTVAVVSLDRDGAPGMTLLAEIGEPRPEPAPDLSFDPLALF